MKTKKNITKQKKKKLTVGSHSNTAIRKAKKVKNVKKVQTNNTILETLKHDLHEEHGTNKQVPNRQQIWNIYLKTFSEVEKLNKKQKQIMEFCTNKSLTPPKRKRKFLNFIRNCFVNQADVTDEQINELFDLLLKRYDDFKSGTYCVANSSDNGSNCADEAKLKLSINKKKKLKRAAAKASLQNVNANNENDEEKVDRVKSKKKKRTKLNEIEVDEENDISISP